LNDDDQGAISDVCARRDRGVVAARVFRGGELWPMSDADDLLAQAQQALMDAHRAQVKAVMAQLRAKRRAAGLCIACGHVKTRRTRCLSCRQKASAIQHRYLQKRNAA